MFSLIIFLFGLVSGILSVPLCLSPVHRTCSHFTMHSYKIINISTLTSQMGGKCLVNSGIFYQDTCNIEWRHHQQQQHQRSLAVSVYHSS